MNELELIAIATAINFISVLVKFRLGRTLDGILDLAIFAAITAMFSGTISGMSVGMVASAIVSLYLWIFPPRILTGSREEIQKILDDFKI